MADNGTIPLVAERNGRVELVVLPILHWRNRVCLHLPSVFGFTGSAKPGFKTREDLCRYTRNRYPGYFSRLNPLKKGGWTILEAYPKYTWCASGFVSHLKDPIHRRSLFHAGHIMYRKRAGMFLEQAFRQCSILPNPYWYWTCARSQGSPHTCSLFVAAEFTGE